MASGFFWEGGGASSSHDLDATLFLWRLPLEREGTGAAGRLQSSYQKCLSFSRESGSDITMSHDTVTSLPRHQVCWIHHWVYLLICIQNSCRRLNHHPSHVGAKVRQLSPSVSPGKMGVTSWLKAAFCHKQSELVTANLEGLRQLDSIESNILSISQER